MGNKKIELADFKEQANTYYKNLTKNAPHKGVGSHEYIYFSYGIEWAFNHLPQSNYDKLKEDNEVLLNALKVCGKMLDEKKRKVNARLTSYEWEIYSTVLKAIKQVESK